MVTEAKGNCSLLFLNYCRGATDAAEGFTRVTELTERSCWVTCPVERGVLLPGSGTRPTDRKLSSGGGSMQSTYSRVQTCSLKWTLLPQTKSNSERMISKAAKSEVCKEEFWASFSYWNQNCEIRYLRQRAMHGNEEQVLHGLLEQNTLNKTEITCTSI